MPHRYNLHPDALLTTGLTVRQEFAKAAMQGLLANPGLTENAHDAMAQEAVAYAEETINALNGEFDQ